MKELISVIIPVYKVEAFLERCVHSVMRQTYENIEIILVDDGSPDNCGAMCDALSTIDARIRVFHKENGGLSDARNHGVERANGRYIAFIDSDDYIAEDYIEYLYKMLQKNGADISCCGLVETSEDTVEFPVNESMPDEQTLTGKDACFGLFGDLYMFLVTACCRLYKAEIVKKHPFPCGKKHEDEATTCKFYYSSQRVALGNRCLYAYYQNSDSITHTQKDKLNVDAIWAFEHRARFFERYGEVELAQLSWNVYFYYCINDSLRFNGRCDTYLEGFDNGRDLTGRVAFEYKLYSSSKILFKAYFATKKALRQIKTRLHNG